MVSGDSPAVRLGHSALRVERTLQDADPDAPDDRRPGADLDRYHLSRPNPDRLGLSSSDAATPRPAELALVSAPPAGRSAGGLRVSVVPVAHDRRTRPALAAPASRAVVADPMV